MHSLHVARQNRIILTVAQRPRSCQRFRRAFLLWRILTLSAPALSLAVTSYDSCAAAENLWLDSARASITVSELHGHVGVLADDTLEGREAGSRGGRAAAKYLSEFLKKSTLTPGGTNDRFTQPFGHNYQNLIAVLEGSDPELKNEHLIVGAHYDHVGYGNRTNSFGPIGYIHNGADDNASGVATLMEMIDALSASEFRPRRTILFSFWDGEEKGLLGSKHWVGNPTVPLENVRLSINVDMVGRVQEGRIEIGGTRTGEGFRRMLSTTSLTPGFWLDFSWEFKDNSDHFPFFEKGVPTIYLHSGLHDDYHRPSDDVERINVEGIQEISRYLLEKVTELADVDELPGFRSQARYENPHSQTRLQQPAPPLASRLGFRWDFVDGPTPMAVVRSVPWNSPAAQAELRTGDRIVAVDGQPLVSKEQLEVAALQAEEQLQLQLASVNPADEPREVSLPLQGKPIRLGLSWREDSAEPDSVFVTRVVPHSPAARAGIKLHDRIYALDGESVQGQAELFERVQEVLANDATQLRLRIETRGNLHELVIPLTETPTSQGDPTL